MSVACKYLTPLKPTPNSKVFRNLHCKFKRLNSFSVSVNGHSENAYLRSLWAHFGRSLHVSQMTANWGRAAFQADEYILGIIANFVRKNFPFRSPGLPVLLVSFPDPKFLFPVI